MPPTRRLAALLVAACAALAAVPGRAPAQGMAPGGGAETVVATAGASPPFAYVEDGEPRGFEIEITRALCAQAGLRCRFVATDWDGLVPGLRRGEFDAVVSAIEITPERRRSLAFTAPILRVPAAFMVRRDDPPPGIEPADLAGLRLGAEQGTAEASYLEDRHAASAKVRLYASLEEASLDLALGRLDAVLGDKFALHAWLERGREASCCRLAGDVPADADYFGEGHGIGLRPGDDGLRLRLDAALAAIRADGTYDRIRARYWPFDVR